MVNRLPIRKGWCFKIPKEIVDFDYPRRKIPAKVLLIKCLDQSSGRCRVLFGIRKIPVTFSGPLEFFLDAVIDEHTGKPLFVPVAIERLAV